MNNSYSSDAKLSSALSIEDAATLFGVSQSTIRNWIKLGYIESIGHNLVIKESLKSFSSEMIGAKKLNNRANKQHKPNASTTQFNPHEWQSYESSLPESYRNREGVYYTPEDIVADLCSKIEPCDFTSKIFLDPCCGSGNFLIRALEIGFQPQNIYGYDIDPQAVKIAKKRVLDISGYNSKNIKCADFLEIAHTLTLRADYIFTNPPWGKKIKANIRKELSSRYLSGGSKDSSSLFLFASLSLLQDGGQIGFLLQEAFFNIGAYYDIRHRLFELRIDHLIDYGRPFKSLFTKAQAVVATNIAHNDTPIMCQHKGNNYLRSRASFECNPQLIYNLATSKEDSEIIESLFCKEHITLKNQAQWAIGIVTGDNQRFCSDTTRKGFKAIYRGADISKQGFSAPKMYIDDNLSIYQQTAPREMYEAPCKLVYKFISSTLCFVCDKEQRFILNSANLLILNDNFPIAPDEFVKFLNCDFTNWLFQHIFSTHKILKGDLEMLPIFIEHFDDGIFCEAKYLERLKIEKRTEGGYSLK